MEVFLIKTLQLFMSLSILVLLHEGGHLFFSKLFGVRVEKFFVFFDVGVGKWSGKLFKFKPKNSDTEYGMGWIPFGGYCKIAGMVDESMDTEQLKQEPQPWEFRTKPAWQRLLIMLGGVMVNFFLALFIYSMIMFAWGETYYRVPDMKMGMAFNTEAKALGFQDHDILLGTDVGPFREYANMNGDFFRQIAESKRVDIIRNGKKMSINMPGNLDMLGMIKTRPLFAEPYIPSKIDSVMAGSPAAKAGIKAGDVITSLNGKAVKTWGDLNYQTSVLNDVMTVKNTHKDSLALRNATLTVQHAGSGQLDTVKLQLTPDLKMGVFQSTLASYYKPTHQTYSFFESFPAGIKYGLNVLSGYVENFKYLASADGAKSIGGFGSLGSLFPASFDWYVFWNLTAFFSIILAFMNILPIPALDGGHVLFLLYEIITRRKPSEKFLIYAEYIGFGILLLLLIWANLNDILRWIGLM